MVLVHGENGQGKSNLLEALYILAIAKSPRASTDRELMRWQRSTDIPHCQLAAVVVRDDGSVRIQIDLRGVPAPEDEAVLPVDGTRSGGQTAAITSVEKYIRVNGVPRAASDLVGEVNAVMFSASDLDIVLGSPSVRRRYMDILISQVDSQYLKALQKYQRIVYQRNHLLKSIRAGYSRPDELSYWDEALIKEGTYVMTLRRKTVERLSELAGPIHRELTGGEELEIAYRPSVDIEPDDTESSLAEAYRQGLDRHRDREVSIGFTITGPHRDDLQTLLDDVDAGRFASRGQCRTIVVAMKLAEAQYLTEQRKQEPVILLDDVLSELDKTRRDHVLETAGRYQQCFVTTTDVGSLDRESHSGASMYAVRRGTIEPETAPPPRQETG